MYVFNDLTLSFFLADILLLTERKGKASAMIGSSKKRRRVMDEDPDEEMKEAEKIELAEVMQQNEDLRTQMGEMKKLIHSLQKPKAFAPNPLLQ